MTFEDTIKADLARLSDDVVGGPDLDRSIAAGRRRRRHRHLTVAATSAAAVGLVAAAAFAFVPGDDSPGTSSQRLAPAGAPNPPEGVTRPKTHSQPGGSADDFVAGTNVDDRLVAALAPLVPAGFTASNVYASDWNRDTPLPDVQAANATDWEVYFATSAGETARVVVGIPDPQENNQVSCGQGSENCTERTLGDGSTLVIQTYAVSDSYFRSAVLQRPDGKIVVASDIVPTPSYAEAQNLWSLDANQLEALATADGLDFPDPVVLPPGH